MSILFTCECGKQYRASAKLAGRKGKCQACGRALDIPATLSGTDPTATQAPQVVSLPVITCESCGKRYKIKAELAGKKAKCTNCQAVLTIPSSTASTILPAQELTRQQASATAPSSGPESTGRNTQPVAVAHAKKRIISVLPAILLGMIVAAAALGMWILTSAGTGADGQTEADTNAKESWPFELPIPDGFEYEGHRVLEGQTLFVLRGKRFGKAQETLVLIETDGDPFRSLTKAGLWAAELCVGLPVGSSELVANTDDLIYHLQSTTVSSEDGRLGPELVSAAPEVEGRNAGDRRPTPFGMSNSAPPSLYAFDLGLSSTYEPTRIAACATMTPGLRLMVAWAGHRDDFEPQQDSVVSPFLLSIAEAEWASDFWTRRHPFDESSFPSGYIYEGCWERGGAKLWAFSGTQRNGIQDTFILVGFPRRRMDVLLACITASRWAADLAAGRPLSKEVAPIITKEMVLIEETTEGQFDLFHLDDPDLPEDTETVETEEGVVRTMTRTFRLVAIGRQTEGTPYVTAGVDDQDGERLGPRHISAVARVLDETDQVLLVFATATEGTAEGFWRAVRLIDNFTPQRAATGAGRANESSDD